MARRDSDADCIGMQSSIDVHSVNLENYRKLVKSYIDRVSLGSNRKISLTVKRQ